MGRTLLRLGSSEDDSGDVGVLGGPSESKVGHGSVEPEGRRRGGGSQLVEKKGSESEERREWTNDSAILVSFLTFSILASPLGREKYKGMS